MVLWVPEAAARIHPAPVDQLLVKSGLADSLTKARRLIQDGAIYLNNVKLEPPAPGYLPVIMDPRFTEWNELVIESLRDGGWLDEIANVV